MPSAISTYGLRSRETQPKDLINHFDLTEIVEGKDQAKEYNDFNQAIQSMKARRKGSRIAQITPPIPQAAQSEKLSPRPHLQDFSHVVIPLSGVRSQLLSPKAIPDDDAYWDTFNIPAFNQDRAKLSEPVIHLKSQSTRKRRITEIRAVANPTRPQPRCRARTPATVKSSSPPSPSSSELSSVNESILADTPEAFQHTASTAITSPPIPTPKTRRRRPRKPRGPRLGFFVEPANARPPLFDYCAAVCQLREYNIRIERGAATRRQSSKLRNTVLKVLKGVYKAPNEAAGQATGHADEDSIQKHGQAKAPAIKNMDEDHPQAGDQATTPVNDHGDEDNSKAHNRATAQETSLEDEEEESSDGDPMDIDKSYTAGAIQPLRALLPQSDTVRARQFMRTMMLRPGPPLRYSQPTWHQVQPFPPSGQFNKRKRSQDDENDSSIQDILQTQAKKARKERSQASTPTTALGPSGSWRKGLIDSAVEAEALKGRR
jgi:hypothetical protein